MTLAIAIQHTDWVAMASDRLLSVGRRPGKRDAVKLVVYFGDMIFGYTGYASLETADGKLLPTDEWIARTLAVTKNRSAVDAVRALRDELDIAFPRMARWDRSFPSQHQILGVGWQRKVGHGIESQRPLFVNISNMQGAKGVALTNPATRFHCSANTYDSLNVRKDMANIRLETVGWYPHQEAREWIAQELNRHASGGLEPLQAVLLMKDMIRQVSKNLGGIMVGEDVLAAFLIRESPSPNHVALIGPQSYTGIVFHEGTVPPMGPARKLVGAYYGFPTSGDTGVYEAPSVVATGFDGVAYFGKMKRRRDFAASAKFHIAKDENGNLISLLGPAITKADGQLDRKSSQKRKRKRRP